MIRPPFVRAALGLVIAAACVTPASPPEVRAASNNLLINPGFEEPLKGHVWMPAGWDTSVAGLPSVFFGRDEFMAHSGQYAVNVANASVVLPLAHNWSQTILVGPKDWGKDAVFSIWTRSNGVEGRAYVLLQAYRDTITKMSRVWNVPRDTARTRLGLHRVDDRLIDFGWDRVFFSDHDTEWVRREMRVYIAPSTNVILVRGGLMGVGQVLLDDASLTFEPARPPAELPLMTNLLADPSFEGDGNEWEYSMPPFLDLHVASTEGVSRTGTRSGGIWGGLSSMVQSRAGFCQVICNRNLAGKRVRLTSHVKTDSLRGMAYIKLYAHTVNGMIAPSTPQQFSATVDWTETSMEMDLPEDTYSLWAWSLINAPAHGKAYFDDMELVVIGPAEQKK
jgi:hypothetical protein